MSLKTATTSSITAPIYLAVDDMTRHWTYFRTTPRTSEERQKSIHKEDVGGTMVAVQQTILNGREVQSNNDADGKTKLTFDEASFELVQCPTALSTEEFYKLQDGDEDIKNKYYDEISSFVKEKLGCDKVICFHSQVRNASKVGQDGSSVQGYAGFAPHTDSSPVSGDLAALHFLGESDDKEDATKYKRYCYMNLWRNISDHPIEDDHLAMLDERTTVKPDDYIVKDLFMDEYPVVQYNLNARHARSTHKWYYFPQMTKSEGILFKQMDSDWTKPGRICFHMSVSDPNGSTAGKPTKPRESIEVRMICYWKEAEVDSMPTKENTNMDKIKNQDGTTTDLSTISSSLESATFFQLLHALLVKIPVVGRIFALVFGDVGKDNSSWFNKKKEPYSGNPGDYQQKFAQAMEYFPYWPSFAKTAMKSVAKSAAMKIRQQKRDADGGDGEDNDNNDKSLKAGIEAVTKIIVDDAAGYQNTKHFSATEKAEIVAYLMSDKTYMASAMKHFGSDMDAGSTTYTGNPKDYQRKFIDTLDGYDNWPKEAKQWAKSTMKASVVAATASSKKNGGTNDNDSDLTEGIREITTRLVLDETGFLGTQSFPEKAKVEISSFLLSDETYMSKAKKTLRGLV